jgi:hypothetical protein
MEGLPEVLSIFSMYDVAVLGASMITVAKIKPVLAPRMKYPELFGVLLPFIVSWFGLMTLWRMGEHTLPEVSFLTFVFGGAGDWLWHRYKGAKNGTPTP